MRRSHDGRRCTAPVLPPRLLSDRRERAGPPLLSLRDLHIPIWLYIIGFGTSLLSSIALTYVVRARARRTGLFDGHDERKIHSGEIPRLGGVAVFAAAMLSLAVVLAAPADAVPFQRGGGLPVLLAGAAATHFVGLYDDLRGMRARYKLGLQLVIAAVVYALGLRVTTLSLPLFGIVPLSPAVGLAFTVVWLVGITNAFNLIDGLDGLAAGAALFALMTLFVAASINHQDGAALVTMILAGATIGFLLYNFHPASIFLGDSGSMFLGFMLAGVGLLSSQKSPTVVAVAIPVVSLGLPVFDTAISIARRFLRGQPIFSADRGHVHHRLLLLGHTPRRAALLLYVACALLAIGGMLLVNDSSYVALVLLVIGLGAGLAIQRLRYHEFEELARVLKKGVRQRSVIGRGVRVREASLRLAQLDDLDLVFEELQSTFAGDEFQRVELRLRPSFVYGEVVAPLDRRLDDDIAVWTWSRSGLAEPSLWEIKLPLLSEVGERVGSLALWQDGLADETSLSHIHTIAGDLRHTVQHKVIALWHRSEARTRLDERAERTPAMERVVPLMPVVEDGHRRVDDRTADGARAPRDRMAKSIGARPPAS